MSAVSEMRAAAFVDDASEDADGGRTYAMDGGTVDLDDGPTPQSSRVPPGVWAQRLLDWRHSPLRMPAWALAGDMLHTHGQHARVELRRLHASCTHFAAADAALAQADVPLFGPSDEMAAIRWAYGVPGLSMPQRAVLVAMAFLCGPVCEQEVTTAALAGLAACSERTAQRATAELVARGLVRARVSVGGLTGYALTPDTLTGVSA